MGKVGLRSARSKSRCCALAVLPLAAAVCPALGCAEEAEPSSTRASLAASNERTSDVLPSLAPNLQVFYDFEHPAAGDPAREADQGLSGTDLSLVNGGEQMRTQPGAYASSPSALQFRQVDPDNVGEDDWKAGLYDEAGVDSLAAFSAVQGTTIMGWVNLRGEGPALNSATPDPVDDRYNAIGLLGLLSGNSHGHGVRALLELITGGDVLRLVALGRRIDEGRSQTFAATEDWQTLLPRGEWVHLAATFDFSTGALELYRNGSPLEGTYTADDDPWEIGAGGELATSPTLPRGIKIGGSFPQNTLERNPCDCQMDSLMFIDRVATPLEIEQQYQRMVSAQP